MLDIRVYYEPANRCFRMWVYRTDRANPGVVEAATGFEFAPLPSDGFAPACTFLKEDEAQQLLQHLWDAGIRPADGSGHTAHIQSLNNHLEDMRSLVFDFDKPTRKTR